jgi:hypothetical protein
LRTFVVSQTRAAEIDQLASVSSAPGFGRPVLSAPLPSCRGGLE